MTQQDWSQIQCPQLIPSLSVRDPRATLAWFEKLGFRTLYSMEMPDGTIGHAHVARGDAHIMLGQASPTCGIGAEGMQLYITLTDETVDALHERARQAGITVEHEPTDQFWGDRTFEVSHPDGYHLMFSQHIRDVSQEEMKAAMEQWAMAAASA